jgi:serine phosphatase RsbU (regulator of sigma subunit)/ketosteroid isomerase-like protein
MSWVAVLVVVLAAGSVAALVAILLLRERRANRRFEILGEIAAVSDSERTLEQSFEAICDILVPELADFCAIDVISDGEVRRAAARAAPGGPPGAEEALAHRHPSLPRHIAGDDGSRSLTPLVIEHVSEADLRGLAHDEDDLESLRRLGIRSMITVALDARGTISGALTLGVAWSHRRYRREDSKFAWILAGRVALALDNSGLFGDLERTERARAEIAETLQRGLMPTLLPHIPGWSVAALYRPAGAENEVGGDFYDAFRMAGGWMLVIGDVTGRGAEAATVTAVARHTLRTAAALTGDPVLALATLNRALLAREDGALCSLVALTIDDDPDQALRLAVAGHPPPLLVEGEEVVEVSAPDPVLGAFPHARWEVEQISLGQGQQLVIVTDGIIEARGPESRFGESRLRAELHAAPSPAHTVQRLEAALYDFASPALEDDVAILAIGRSSAELRATRWGDNEDARLVERLYDAFNRRDETAIIELCDERMEFHPPVTAGAAGRGAPYVGPEGLRRYLADVGEIWEELLVHPGQVERRGDRLLVRGRIHGRSHELGIRDVPVAWIWEARDGVLLRGEVFPDPEEAAARFGAVAA